jgi:hypothetical protein
MEVAIGASISGVRAMASMKHVGVNVASDPLYTVAYSGVNGGLVLASDGTVGYGAREFAWIFGDRIYTSNNDESFQNQCWLGNSNNGRYIEYPSPGNDESFKCIVTTRNNDGWITYRYSNNKVLTSTSVGYSLTIEGMLNVMN